MLCMSNMLDKLSYNSKELEQATGISIKQWRELRDKGMIKTSIIGRREIWQRSDVEDVLSQIKGTRKEER